MIIRPAVDTDRADIRALLQDAALPVADLDAATIHFLVAVDSAHIVGVVGLQPFGDTALLRSLALRSTHRGVGEGRRLVAGMEARARELGVSRLVLLTTTAADFFVRLGYAHVARDALPADVLQSAEFRSLCPASAACMEKWLPPRKRVLFVCVENSNRSQMAEGFARRERNDVESLSAGSAPSGRINPKAIRFMQEIGLDISAHASKSLEAIEGDFDAVVTMGCGDRCPWIPAKRREDWALPDPRDMDDTGYRAVRDDIARRVKALLASL